MYGPIELIILVLLMVGSAGCIKVAENALGGGKSGGTGDSSSSPGIPAVLRHSCHKVRPRLSKLKCHPQQ